jgi:hypothetical protein
MLSLGEGRVRAAIASSRGARSMTMKKTLILFFSFMALTILAPVVIWVFFDIEGTVLSKVFGYMIFAGLAAGGWLGWTLLERAFFRN